MRYMLYVLLMNLSCCTVELRQSNQSHAHYTENFGIVASYGKGSTCQAQAHINDKETYVCKMIRNNNSNNNNNNCSQYFAAIRISNYNKGVH